MKNALLLFILSISLNSVAQGCLTKDSIFQSIDDKLIISKVINVDSTSQKQLVIKVKNWASTQFVNSKEVLVSETENQLVYNYIITNTGGMVTRSEYIRLVIQVKDNKIKVEFFDDGNVYVPSTQYAAAQSARSTYYSSWFAEDRALCNKGIYKGNYKLIQEFKLSITSNLSNFEKEILKIPTTSDDGF
jgi:hypothetical protein